MLQCLTRNINLLYCLSDHPLIYWSLWFAAERMELRKYFASLFAIAPAEDAGKPNGPTESCLSIVDLDEVIVIPSTNVLLDCGQWTTLNKLRNLYSLTSLLSRFIVCLMLRFFLCLFRFSRWIQMLQHTDPLESRRKMKAKCKKGNIMVIWPLVPCHFQWGQNVKL